MGQNLRFVHTLGLSHRFSRWHWHRFGDTSKTKHIMSRKQKTNDQSSSLLPAPCFATVVKNKKKKRRSTVASRRGFLKNGGNALEHTTP